MIRFPFFLARRFVAGATLADALVVARQLHKKGIFTTLDHLGEDVTNKRTAQRATTMYLHLLDRLHREHLDAHISIKLSQLGLAIDKRLALRNAQKIIRRGKKHRIMVEIDMEGSRYTEDTLNIFLSLLRTNPRILMAIQAYLYRSTQDVRTLLKKRGSVRLVKGVYKEPDTLAFKNKEEVNINYLKLVASLLQKGMFTAVATHDEKIIHFIKQFVRRKKISKKKFMFEMLYGIRRDLQEELAREGYCVYVYVPYGDQWFPYYWRRIRERKENFFFVLKHLFRA
jgi:proline dehydrogenase